MMKFGQVAGGMGKKEFRNEEDANLVLPDGDGKKSDLED